MGNPVYLGGSDKVSDEVKKANEPRHGIYVKQTSRQTPGRWCLGCSAELNQPDCFMELAFQCSHGSWNLLQVCRDCVKNMNYMLENPGG